MTHEAFGVFLLLTVQRFHGFGQEIEKKAALQLAELGPWTCSQPCFGCSPLQWCWVNYFISLYHMPVFVNWGESSLGEGLSHPHVWPVLLEIQLVLRFGLCHIVTCTSADTNHIRAVGIPLFKNISFVKMSTRMGTVLRLGLDFTTTDVHLPGTSLKSLFTSAQILAFGLFRDRQHYSHLSSLQVF